MWIVVLEVREVTGKRSEEEKAKVRRALGLTWSETGSHWSDRVILAAVLRIS